MRRLGAVDADLRELYVLGKDKTCGEWALDTSRLYLKPTPRLTCVMPEDHEYLYGVPHVDLENCKVWRNGLLDDLLITVEEGSR